MPQEKQKVIATVEGVVISGSKKASALGFPTVNIGYAPGTSLPPIGIYAGTLTHGEKTYPGAICLGPAADSNPLKLEIHCFESLGVREDDRVSCAFLKKLSDFVVAGENDTKQKIAEDVVAARRFFHLTSV